MQYIETEHEAVAQFDENMIVVESGALDDTDEINLYAMQAAESRDAWIDAAIQKRFMN